MSAPRDFRAALSGTRCWDRDTQAVFEQHGEALEDCVLQSREELIVLCETIDRLQLRSFLEIGTWTGALTRCLDRIFDFERLAVCDDGWCEQRGLAQRYPSKARVFRGDSGSERFARWREALGPMDLVLIDANHAHHAVLRDFELQRIHPHRVLAFHDITGANRYTAGVGRFWRELKHGWVREILAPHRELGLDHSVMGIGLWAAHPPEEQGWRPAGRP